MSHVDVHREHQAWSKDAAFWRDEAALWRADAEQALAEVERFAEALRDDLQSLKAHEETVLAHLQRMELHEHALAEFETQGRADELLLRGKRHRTEAAQHLACSQAHDNVKRLHHAVLEDWLRHAANAAT